MGVEPPDGFVTRRGDLDSSGETSLSRNPTVHPGPLLPASQTDICRFDFTSNWNLIPLLEINMLRRLIWELVIETETDNSKVGSTQQQKIC